MRDIHERLHRTKLSLLAVNLTIAGVALMVGAKWLAGQPGWFWLANLPVVEVGSTLFIAGLVSIALDYVDGHDREERDTARLQRVLRTEAADIRDAVIQGFAFEPDHLARCRPPS